MVLINTRPCVCKVSSHPVTEDAGARVRGLYVSDERDVLQSGEEEQQKTLHSYG